MYNIMCMNTLNFLSSLSKLRKLQQSYNNPLFVRSEKNADAVVFNAFFLH